MDTPSSVMYADLKAHARLSNRETARLLLNGDFLSGGTPIRDRVDVDRTFLSREVVHALPGEIPAEAFGDIAQAALSIAARAASKADAGPAESDAAACLDAHYRGPAARAMREALDACGADGTAYGNAVEQISRIPLERERDRGTLLLMLFLATGCLGEPARAANVVEGYLASRLSTEMHTTETGVGTGTLEVPVAAAPVRLGLMRVIDGLVKPPLHPLSVEPGGTVIGQLATGPGDISDVDGDVSRSHLRVWLDAGRWLAQGLGSTNGSAVISGDDRSVRVIEPPRSQRVPGETYPPVRLLNSDVLCLGASTRFLVMQMVG